MSGEGRTQVGGSIELAIINGNIWIVVACWAGERVPWRSWASVLWVRGRVSVGLGHNAL